MRDIIASLIFVALGLIWYVTGRSPLLWGAIAFTHAESFRRQVIATTWVAMVHFWKEYRATAVLVRKEVAE